MMSYVVIDYETRGATDLKMAGSWCYSECPMTEIICLHVRSFTGKSALWHPGLPMPSLLSEAIRKGWTVIAHNVGFEKAIWRNIQMPVYGWPDIPDAQWHDTMAVCAMLSIPLGLDQASAVLRLSAKDAEGSKFTVGLSKVNRKGMLDMRPESLQRVYDYCASDTAVELQLHHAIGWLPPEERDVWLLDQTINQRGVKLDLDYISACLKVIEADAAPLLAEFAGITGGLKPTQVQKFQAWLQKDGVTLPNLDAETLEEYLEDVPEGSPEPAHRALRIRQLIGSTSVKKLPRMLASVCADRRARGLLQYHGTSPGRWAGRGFQPQNFPRGTVKADPDIVINAMMTADRDIVEVLLGPPTKAVVSGLRHAIIAEKGHVFLSGDYSGIQARTVLALAGQHDKAALMAAGHDVYCDMASTIHGRPITKADKEERQDGKNTVLGCGFGMGPKKFRDKYARNKPLDFAIRNVQAYRKAWAPQVPKLWYGLHGAASMAVHTRLPHSFRGIEYKLENGWLTARSPAGYKIWYRNPQPTRDVMPWDENDVRPGFSYHAQKMGHWKEIRAFGGLLTENIVMRIEVDLMIHGMKNCEAAGFPIVMTVHDEIIAEVPVDRADEKAFAQCMTDVPQWCKDLQIPVAVETWQGERYRK